MNPQDPHDNLKRFLKRWKIEDVKNMTLQEYNNVGSKDSFCYWLEHETENLGRIGGTPSNKFGIWEVKTLNQGTSKDFISDGNYKWYAKYGKNRTDAFNRVKELIIEVIEYVSHGEFYKIEQVDYFALVKWKIAFIYSNYRLIPVYLNSAVRNIAKNFDYYEYNTAPLYQLHKYILEQKNEIQDFFEFSFEQYHIAVKEQKKNYYIIGSKYSDEFGNNTVDISPKLYQDNIIATGFFGREDLSHLYGKGKTKIDKWIDKNLKTKYPDKYQNAKRTLSFFLGIKVGDIIAVKSHGQYGGLTIIAYAEVIEVNGKVYYHSQTNGLGHCINVSYIETGLYKYVGLNYGRTIHQIVPFQRKGHFEKIFGSYSFDELNDSVTPNYNIELTESRINEKQTEEKKRQVSYSTTVRKIHNKIQSSFAKHLQNKYPDNYIKTEHNYIDVVMQSETELYYYEVKPDNSVYACIRSGIGQLLDYYHKNPHSKKTVHIRIVGTEKPNDDDIKFIEFLKDSLKVSFDYIRHEK